MTLEAPRFNPNSAAAKITELSSSPTGTPGFSLGIIRGIVGEHAQAQGRWKVVDSATITEANSNEPNIQTAILVVRQMLSPNVDETFFQVRHNRSSKDDRVTGTRFMFKRFLGANDILGKLQKLRVENPGLNSFLGIEIDYSEREDQSDKNNYLVRIRLLIPKSRYEYELANAQAKQELGVTHVANPYAFERWQERPHNPTHDDSYQCQFIEIALGEDLSKKQLFPLNISTYNPFTRQFEQSDIGTLQVAPTQEKNEFRVPILECKVISSNDHGQNIVPVEFTIPAYLPMGSTKI